MQKRLRHYLKEVIDYEEMLDINGIKKLAGDRTAEGNVKTGSGTKASIEVLHNDPSDNLP